MMPPPSTRSRKVASAATSGAAVSRAASAAGSVARRTGQPEQEPAAGRVQWQGHDAERGSGRHRHLLEPLAVRGEGVLLQGLGGVSLQLAGKLVARGCLNAVTPGQLVHIVDQLTGRRFLIDTGASYSIFPHRSTSPPSEPHLTGASGQRIPCWGVRVVQLDFHGRRFEWTFLLADVTFAIIGVDFLSSNKLLVDPVANCLVDTASLQSFAIVSAAAACAASAVQSPPSPESTGSCGGDAAVERAASPLAPPPLSLEWLKVFLAEFEDVVCPYRVLPPEGTDVEHQTSGPPIASSFRRLDAEKLSAAKAEFCS
jgi:hypothetical protein